MADEDNILEPEQVAEIIAWAVGAGALLKLLEMRPDSMPEAEELDVLRHTVDTINDNMPGFLADYALDAGIELFEDYEETERLVEEFRQELDEL